MCEQLYFSSNRSHEIMHCVRSVLCCVDDFHFRLIIQSQGINVKWARIWTIQMRKSNALPEQLTEWE